jgi:hypothetical protein
MKKKVQIYFEPIEKEIELPEGLDEREIEEEINWNVYTYMEDEILNQASISYWEEI